MLGPLGGWHRGFSSWIQTHLRVPGAQGQLVDVMELAACVFLDALISQELRSVPRQENAENLTAKRQLCELRNPESGIGKQPVCWESRDAGMMSGTL